MEFKNKTELLYFEKQRENFISKEMVEIHQNPFSCYWQMLKYLFNKKYRNLSKLYYNYSGGFYRQKDGIICATTNSAVENVVEKKDIVIFI